MIKHLKLQKAVYAVILGVVSLIVAQLMSAYEITGASYVLGFSGLLMVVGACLFIYPIVFAEKDPEDENHVHLKPIEKEEKPTEN